MIDSRRSPAIRGAALAGLLLGLSACGDAPSPPGFLPVAGGDAERGHRLIHAYGCGTCHVVEGVRGARGNVGPRLVNYAQQNLLGGRYPNTPRVLVAFLINPPAFAPSSGMPVMGITEAEARDMAAYLYSLGAGNARVHPPDPPLAIAAPPTPDVTIAPDDAGASPETIPRTRRLIPERSRGRETPGS